MAESTYRGTKVYGLRSNEMSTLPPSPPAPRGPDGPRPAPDQATGADGPVTRVNAALEEALADHVARLGRNRLQPSRFRAVIERLGFAGRPPLTLVEAGRVAGLSGERVRQLERRLREQQRKAGEGPGIPQLDAALALVARALPLRAVDVPGLLLAAGIAAGPFSAPSLRSAAELLGLEVPFVCSGKGDSAMLVPSVAPATVEHLALVEARVRRQTERCGAASVAQLEAELAGEGLTISRRDLRVVLRSCPSVVALTPAWFGLLEARPTAPFVRASLRMLAVTPALSLATVHDGLRRHNAFRRLPPPPPQSVLANVYRRHPTFRFEKGLVSARQAVEPGVVGPLNRRMVEILRAAPGGVLPRTGLLESCHEAGLNLTSVNLYTTYSECIERVGPGLFAPRGAPRRAAGRPPLRIRPAAGADDRPVHGWTADGLPWLSGRITPSIWANGVVHVPAELQPILEGRRFPSSDADHAKVTTIGVDCHGNSWGWTSFLRRAGAQVGDVVRAVFDPVAGTAVLEVVAGAAAAGPVPGAAPAGGAFTTA